MTVAGSDSDLRVHDVFARRRHISELDGIRGLAILAVMLFHARVPPFEGGFAGVEVFFVLSGFLITSLLFVEHESINRISLGCFYARRALRLTPALLLLIVVFCIWSWGWLPLWQAKSNTIDSAIAFSYLTNWGLALSLRPPSMVGHTWSLSIEEQFYLFWAPALALAFKCLGRSRGLLVLALSIAAFSWAWRIALLSMGEPFVRVYSGLDTRLDGLMLGAATALAVSLGIAGSLLRRPSAGTALKFLSPVCLAALFAMCVFARWQEPWLYRYGLVAIELCTVVVILDVIYTQGSPVAAMLRNSALVWIGTISYGLYIWHYPIYQCLLFIVKWDPIKTFLLGSPIVFVVAALSYYLVERPILRFKKHFVPK
ncbi:MAG: acyltransferase [Verrucomicrobiae bacterium]